MAARVKTVLMIIPSTVVLVVGCGRYDGKVATPNPRVLLYARWAGEPN